MLLSLDVCSCPRKKESADCLDYAGWADKIEGESFAADDGTYKIVRQEPLGVCAGIAPWNAPMLYVAWKIAPAVAAGNTVCVCITILLQY